MTRTVDMWNNIAVDASLSVGVSGVFSSSVNTSYCVASCRVCFIAGWQSAFLRSRFRPNVERIVRVHIKNVCGIFNSIVIFFNGSGSRNGRNKTHFNCRLISSKIRPYKKVDVRLDIQFQLKITRFIIFGFVVRRHSVLEVIQLKV